MTDYGSVVAPRTSRTTSSASSMKTDEFASMGVPITVYVNGSWDNEGTVSDATELYTLRDFPVELLTTDTVAKAKEKIRLRVNNSYESKRDGIVVPHDSWRERMLLYTTEPENVISIPARCARCCDKGPTSVHGILDEAEQKTLGDLLDDPSVPWGLKGPHKMNNQDVEAGKDGEHRLRLWLHMMPTKRNFCFYLSITLIALAVLGVLLDPRKNGGYVVTIR